MTAANLATWIGIAAALATAVARFSALEEARSIATQHITDHEVRIKNIELDRSTLLREHALEISINELKYEVQALRTDVHEMKKRK